MMKVEYIASGGEYGFINPLLIGKRILSVMKDGVGMSKIVSITPVDKQAQYLNYSGEIKFANQMGKLEDSIVLYEDDPDACFIVRLQEGFILPDAKVGFPYSASFFINGTGPFVKSADSYPAWMTVTVSPTMVTFSGTPAMSDAGSDAVGFTLSNDCGSVNFSQSLEVIIPAAKFEATTFLGGDRATDSEIANLFGIPGVVITVTLDTLTNSNGGTLKVNNIVVSVSDTFSVTVGADGKGSLAMKIEGDPDVHGTVILGHFTITSVSVGTIGAPATFQISKVF